VKKEIDWVQLGCLGWDIEPEGAGMDCEWQEGPGFRCHEDDYAHIDRETHHLILVGCPEFVAMVITHMMGCVYIRLGGPKLMNYVRFAAPGETFTGSSRSIWQVMNDS